MFVLAAEAWMVIEEVLNCTETWKKTVKKNAIFLLLSDDVGQIASSEEPTALLRIYSSISSRLLQVKGYSLLLEYRMRCLA